MRNNVLLGLLSKICKASDFYSTEVVGEAADMIDAVYDYACEIVEQCWRDMQMLRICEEIFGVFLFVSVNFYQNFHVNR